jgi:hypothetical protein
MAFYIISFFYYLYSMIYVLVSSWSWTSTICSISTFIISSSHRILLFDCVTQTIMLGYLCNCTVTCCANASRTFGVCLLFGQLTFHPGEQWWIRLQTGRV